MGTNLEILLASVVVSLGAHRRVLTIQCKIAHTLEIAGRVSESARNTLPSSGLAYRN